MSIYIPLIYSTMSDDRRNQNFSLSDSLSMDFEDEYLLGVPSLVEVRKIQNNKKKLTQAFARSFVCDYIRFLSKREYSITLLQFYYTFADHISKSNSFQNLIWRCLCKVGWIALDPFICDEICYRNYGDLDHPDEFCHKMNASMFLDEDRVKNAIDCLNHSNLHELHWSEYLL